MFAGVPLHPMIVHIPLVLAGLAPLVFAWLTWRAFRPGGPPRRAAWGLAVGLMLVVAGGALASSRTGEAEEERVEDAVSEAAIHEHEEAAERFVPVAIATLALALLGLGLPRAGKAFAPLGLVAALALVGLGVDLGHKGGQLVYVHGAGSVGSPAAAGAPAAAPAAGARDDDD